MSNTIFSQRTTSKLFYYFRTKKASNSGTLEELKTEHATEQSLKETEFTHNIEKKQTETSDEEMSCLNKKYLSTMQ